MEQWTHGSARADARKSSLYRFFFPRDANFDVKINPYSGSDPNNSYNPADGAMPTINNSFADHKA